VTTPDSHPSFHQEAFAVTRAAVLYEFGSPLAIEEIDVEEPRAGEVMVRMAASGVCHSDLHIQQGIHPCHLPAVLGHEGAGIVAAVGAGVSELRPGDHVILSWLPYCGRCRFCLSGRAVLCDDLGWSDAGTMTDGTTRFSKAGRRILHSTSSSFAEVTVVPAQTAIKVDESLDLVELALLGCAVMTGVGAVFNTARVRPGDSVAVVGCGGVGLSVVQGARIAGATTIVAIDPVEAKRELAKKVGATDAIGPESGTSSSFREILPEGADFAFEALGRPETIEAALGLAGKGGTTILIGMAPPSAEVTINPLTMTLSEQAIKGCWYGSCRPPADFSRLVDLYRNGALDLKSMITKQCRLEDVDAAFAAMERGEVARTVINYGL
jgi:S-(hydroxymethyl)glutathione dehydrogenase / alcohol dehydrogenase